MDDNRLDRRSLLRAAAGAAVAGTGAATASGGGNGTGTGNESGGESGSNGPPRRLVIPDVDLFERGVVGQYVIVTDPAGTPTDPIRLPDCPVVNWPAGATRRYQGLVLDRLTDEPRATNVPVFVNAERADATIGTPYVVTEVEQCDEYLGLRVEPVAVTDATGSDAAENGTAGNGTGG